MNPHILLVDDEAALRDLLTRHFRQHGYEVVSVGNSADALRRLEQTPFKLVILDVDIAGESGLELLPVLKAKYPKLPVILFTGLDTDEDLLAKAVARGADGFMRKTDPLQDLLREAQRFVPKP